MGVLPPPEEEFDAAAGKSSNGEFIASSPTEGILILEPPQIVEESTGKFHDAEEADPPGIEVEVITTAAKSSKKKNK